MTMTMTMTMTTTASCRTPTPTYVYYLLLLLLTPILKLLYQIQYLTGGGSSTYHYHNNRVGWGQGSEVGRKRANHRIIFISRDDDNYFLCSTPTTPPTRFISREIVYHVIDANANSTDVPSSYLGYSQWSFPCHTRNNDCCASHYSVASTCASSSQPDTTPIQSIIILFNETIVSYKKEDDILQYCIAFDTTTK